MRVLVSGSSGLIGRALVARLEESGDEVVRLVRRETHEDTPHLAWDPEKGALAPDSIEGFDAVMHLAGESVASGRWNAARKQRIMESRQKGTQLLSDALARAGHKPKVLISASAIGIYGDRGEEKLDEDSSSGKGFLADVCRAWEAATESASEAGIRVVRLRLGMVLSAEGGALARMLPPFRLGLGGPLGNGAMFMSWITLEDVIGAITFAVAEPALQGPVNGVSPHPVRNRAFTQSLAKALHRPALIPVPRIAVRLALGEMGEALALSSSRVYPKRLEDAGYVFRDPEIGAALENVLTAKA